MTPHGLPLLAFLLAGGRAWAEEPSRDEDIFGASAPSGALPEAPDPGAALAEADRRLVLGGRLYLRSNAFLPEAPTLASTQMNSPNLLDLFADARLDTKVRAFAQGRLIHDWTATEGATGAWGAPLDPDRVLLDQLWLNLDVRDRVFVTAGRQRIKWGAGRFWNPTDFLDPARLDALAFFDERTGVPLLKLHLPGRNLNLYGIASFDQARSPRDIQGALRAELLVGLTEIALSTALREGDPLRFGGQWSAGLGPVDFKGEVALLHGVESPRWTGAFAPESLSFPEQVSLEDDWIVQAVGAAEVGIRYGDQDSVFLGAEFFHNDLGYEDASLYPWLLAQGQFEPFYLGRHYVGAYIYLPAPGLANDWSFILSSLANLSDASQVSRLDVSIRALTRVNVNAYAQLHHGKEGEFRFSIEIPEIPGVLDEGLVVPPPLLDLGLGASVSF